MRFPTTRVLFFLLGISLWGCDDAKCEDGCPSDGGTETTGGMEVDFAADLQPILNANCLCHMGSEPDGEMSLHPDMAPETLIGVPARGLPSMNRIEPGDPDQSYLWHKLNGTHLMVGGDGIRMPPMPPGRPLDAETMALIEGWILSL